MTRIYFILIAALALFYNREEKHHHSIEINIDSIKSSVTSNINEGGCGVFAYYLHKRLKDLGISSTIYAVSEKGINGENVQNEIYNGNGWFHFVIKVNRDDGFIDSDGFHVDMPQDRLFWHKKYEVEPFVLRGMLEKNIWNKSFCLKERPLLISAITKNVNTKIE